MIPLLQYRSENGFFKVSRPNSVHSGIYWHGSLIVIAVLLHALCNPAHADDSIPPPSNLEDARSDVLQLDRDLAHLKQRIFQPQRTVLLFGITPLSKLTVNSVQVSLDGRPLPSHQYNQGALDALLKGGMDTLMDSNLSPGAHELNVTVSQNNHATITQQIKFTKTVEKDILGIQLVERPGLGELPLKLVEWSQHD
jgi:hypothetical protein